MGDNHPNWKGDMVSIPSLHQWMNANFKKPEVCQICNKKKPLDLSNNGIYDRNIENWEWLCRECHLKKDGRNHKGVKNSQHKLKPEQIKEIRKKYSGNFGDLTKIGKEYGVSYWTISQIVNFKTWTHIK